MTCLRAHGTTHSSFLARPWAGRVATKCEQYGTYSRGERPSLDDFQVLPLDHTTTAFERGTAQVAGNYQYQWARRMLCDPASTIAGGMQKTQLKRRLSGLLGVELSDREIEVLFQKYADP